MWLLDGLSVSPSELDPQQDRHVQSGARTEVGSTRTCSSLRHSPPRLLPSDAFVLWWLLRSSSLYPGQYRVSRVPLCGTSPPTAKVMACADSALTAGSGRKQPRRIFSWVPHNVLALRCPSGGVDPTLLLLPMEHLTFAWRRTKASRCARASRKCADRI